MTLKKTFHIGEIEVKKIGEINNVEYYSDEDDGSSIPIYVVENDEVLGMIQVDPKISELVLKFQFTIFNGNKI